MMKKLTLTISMVMLFVAMSIAQRTITGKISDGKGEALIGASIQAKGSTVGTVTDVDGLFSIDVPNGTNSLVVSYTGYTTQEVEIGNLTQINVILEEGVAIQEVVVTALGIQKQPKQLGYSVATVKNDDLTQSRVTSLQNGLVGKVSGLQISTTNNGIDANTRITLRGVRSLLGNNQALLVIDGTPMNLNFINSINPNDVESVNILKGANAATLYGPEGVNGVIVVTTKKGSGSSKPQINVSHSNQWEKIAFLPALQTRFGAGSAFNSFGDGIYDPIENQSWGPEFDGSVRVIGQETFDGKVQEVPYSYIPGEKNRFWELGRNIQNDVSISSGDDNSNFYLSFQNLKAEAVMPSDAKSRNTIRLNAGKKYGIFNTGLNMGYTLTNKDNTTAGAAIYTNVQNTPGSIPLTSYKNLDDYWSNVNNYFNDYFQNPYQTIHNNRSKSRSDDLFGNATFSLKPLKWLDITDRLGFTYSSGNSKAITRAVDYSDFAIHHRSFASSGSTKAAVGDGFGFQTRINNELLLSTNHKVGSFSVNGLLGNLIRESRAKAVSVNGGNLVIPTLFNVANRTGEPGASEGNALTRLFSVFGSLSLGYKDWAFVEITGRNDWDSRLPTNKQSYFYPGVNASLILTDMIPSLKSNDFMNYAKLKGAYSITGNVYTPDASSVTSGAYLLESTFSQVAGFPYGTLPGFSADGTINNPQIKPEVVRSTEVGAEFGFLRSRIIAEAAYYFQDNNDQVVPIGISNSTGYASAFLNAARFNNRGFEADLRLTPFLKFGPTGTWELSANYNYNTSKVLSVYEGLDELFVGNTAYIVTGYPAYTHKLKDWLRDPQGRVIIDPVSGYPKQNPVNTYFGRTNPKHIVGITNELNFKGLSLRAVAEYRGGSYIVNGQGPTLDFTGISKQSATNGRQRFVFPNSVIQNADGSFTENKDIAVKNAHYDFLQATVFRNVQTNYYSSADFWKLREVVLSYTLPANILASSKIIKKATFSLVGRNLMMLRPETNQWTDPEFSNTVGNAVGFTDNGQSPPTRLFGFNVNLTF